MQSFQPEPELSIPIGLNRESQVPASGFSRNSRLLKAAEYKAVFDGAQFNVSCRHFLILAGCSEFSKSRLGLVVAKKNIPGAVQRNRIKRHIREAFRQSPGLASPLDLVVLVRKDADKLNDSQLSQQISSLFQDLNIKLKAAPKHIGRS